MKQVIIVNEVLKLPRGKLAAQVAHASVASLMSSNGEQQKAWFEVGMPKVVLVANTEKEVIELYQKAVDANFPAYLIKDAVKTVVEAGTITCIGIGPDTEGNINEITGHLKLL